MSSKHIKLAAALLALAGLGGGLAYFLQQQNHGGPAANKRRAATLPQWQARVTTIAGDGMPGAGEGSHARFADPFGLVLDAAGNFYVADGGDNNRIRKIGPDGVASTLAGAREGYAEGSGAAASFNTPSGLAIDGAGNLYVADTGNNAIRKISPQGQVTTLAGNGIAGFQDGKGAAAQFNGPLGVAVDAAGVVYVADTYNDRIRRIGPDGEVSTIAGGARHGLLDGPALQARFDTPCALVLTPEGDLIIADTRNDALRKLGRDGQVSTIARAPEDDRKALLRRPQALALTHDGYLYIASGAHGRVAQLAPSGQLGALTDADQPPEPLTGQDGSVRLYAPRALALAPDGALYATDGATFRLQRLAPPQPGQRAAPPLPPPAPPARTTAMPWPLKPQDRVHEVVGLLGEVRGNFDGDSRDHFHAGLDVQGAIGAPVLTMLAAKVSDPLPNWGFGELSEGVSLAGTSYIHMRVGRDAGDAIADPRFQLLRDDNGKPERIRLKRGTRFEAGETIGSINRMAHVHLDYSPNGGQVNALSLPFPGLRDTIAPQIVSIGLQDASGRLLTARKGQPLKVARALGDVGIVVDAFDQIDGNQARRRLGLYQLGYQLLDAEGRPLPGYAQPLITQRYDQLPRNREAVRLAYADSSGITVHGSKATRFVYALNNKILDGRAIPGQWRVADLAPGAYILRIYAADYAGNVATSGRDLALRIE